MIQTYQQVSKIITEDLKELYELGVRNLNKINLKEFQGDFQGYIFYKQNKDPKRYERLTFNRNMPEPLSEDLGRIVGGFMIDGCLDYERNIRIENVKKYLKKWGMIN